VNPALRALLAGRTVRILAFACLAGLYLGFLLITLPAVPFHPDEATYIYMSRDLDRIIAGGPLSVCWRSGGGSDPLQVERERDCPLTRYAVGLARLTGGLPATDANWNWGSDWEQNLGQGAVPSDRLMLLARIPEVLLLFLSVLLMARIGLGLGGGVGAVSAAVLFGLNSQILLHGRRAMSEAGVLFGMILVVAVLLERRNAAGPRFRNIARPLLTGAALAIAVSAKYSGLLIAPVAVVGMFFIDPESPWRRRLWHGILRIGVMAAAFLAVFLLLNPVYWCDLLGTLSAVVAERRRLSFEQVQTLHLASRVAVLDSIPIRLLAPLYEWLMAPLAFWDVPNYSAATSLSEAAYVSQPLHMLTTGSIGGLVSTVLAFLGLGGVIARKMPRGSDASPLIAAAWFICIFVGIVAVVPILWQRYYLPLIPAGAVLSAVAINDIVCGIRKRNRQD
jgi:hypothetical protein